ncbi:MAG: response regulator [Pirellulales bacterium]
MERRKARILIAGGSESGRTRLKAYLDGANREFAVEVDGRGALAAISSFGPDLVVLGAIESKPIGLEVCKQLKHDPATAGVMVLMIVPLGDLGDIERVVEAGADDFLSEPPHAAELRTRVDNLLRLRL